MIKQHTDPAKTVAKEILGRIVWDKVSKIIFDTVFFYNKKQEHPLRYEDVQDISQDACEKTFAGLPGYNPNRAELVTWACKIAIHCYWDTKAAEIKRNRFSTSYKSNRIRKDDEILDSLIDSPLYCESNEAFAREVEGLLSLVLKPLCETYRTTIMCLIDEIEKEEMIKRVHCSPKNLKSTISRARKAARKSLTDLGII